MTTETVCISREEYKFLKNKEAVADDILFQLKSSLDDLEKGRLRKVR